MAVERTDTRSNYGSGRLALSSVRTNRNPIESVADPLAFARAQANSEAAAA